MSPSHPMNVPSNLRYQWLEAPITNTHGQKSKIFSHEPGPSKAVRRYKATLTLGSQICPIYFQQGLKSF
jgi:hypothetical protein